jgi:hypothetical protein
VRWLAPLALSTSLLAPSPASAAPVTIGAGSKPGIAIDGNGTAYIAWYGTEPSGPTSLHFCRLPRNASSCDVNQTLTPVGQTLSRPFVRVSGSRVDIVNSRLESTAGAVDETLRFTSTDGGATFSGSSSVGTKQFDEAAGGPGDAIMIATNANTSGGFVQRVPLDGSAATTAANLFPATYLYNGTVGLINGATPLALFADASSQAAFRIFGGGDYNDQASWSAPVTIGYADYPKLAGGPGGLFLLAGTASRALAVRRFNGSTFGAGVQVTPNGDASEAHLFQDAGGRLHAVWTHLEAGGWHLDHAYSDDGVHWQTDPVAVQTDDDLFGLRVATAADHAGYAVWTSRANGVSQVRVAAIAPTPVFHKSVVVERISGTVRVKRPGSNAYVPLTGAQSVALGSSVDVKQGRLALSSAPKRGVKSETAQFYSGVFKVTQPGSITELRLTEALASCRKGAKAAAKKATTRRLWGDGAGSFRTRGQYSAATVRGTRWLVQDSCAGTLTRAAKGAVAVRDFRTRRTVVVRAGKSYLAKPR